MPLAAVLDRPV